MSPGERLLRTGISASVFRGVRGVRLSAPVWFLLAFCGTVAASYLAG